MENKHIRNQLLAINENKTTVTDDINKLKSKIAIVATASESNRQRLIEIERTISSEFYPTHIPPPSENTPNRNNLTQNESPVNESHNQQDERHESSAKSTLDLLIIGSSIMRYIDRGVNHSKKCVRDFFFRDFFFDFLTFFLTF